MFMGEVIALLVAQKLFDSDVGIILSCSELECNLVGEKAPLLPCVSFLFFVYFRKEFARTIAVKSSWMMNTSPSACDVWCYALCLCLLICAQMTDKYPKHLNGPCCFSCFNARLGDTFKNKTRKKISTHRSHTVKIPTLTDRRTCRSWNGSDLLKVLLNCIICFGLVMFFGGFIFKYLVILYRIPLPQSQKQRLFIHFCLFSWSKSSSTPIEV